MINTISDNERESLGAFLRRNREEQGLTLEKVADATKISIYSLNALEEDDYANLPADAFVRGFCGIYAEYLSLDTGMIRERYNQQQKNLPRRGTRNVPTPTQLAHETSSMAERPSVTSHSIIGLSLLAILVVVTAVCWYFSWNPATFLSQKLRGVSEEKVSSSAPQVPVEEAIEPQAPQIAPAPIEPVAVTAKPDPSINSPVTVTPVTEELTLNKPIMTTPLPSVTSSASTQTTKEKEAAPAGTTANQSVQQTETSNQAKPVNASTYILKAFSMEATQVTVKVDDSPAEKITLTAGGERSWNAGKSIVITLPAGSTTKFTLNDIPLNLPKKDPGQEITVNIPEYLLE